MTAPLLSQDFLQRLARLRMSTRRPVRGGLRGVHASAAKGSGMEFADFREYQEGDDLKNVDWRTYMRLDRLVVKLFVEETDLPVYIFLDTSASMGCGAPSPLDYGRRLAGALAHIGLTNMDRVSLIAYADGVVKDMTGLRGSGQTWPALAFLQGLAAGGRTELETCLKRYFAAPRARGMIVVISDFLDPGGFAEGLGVLRALRHEVVVVQLTDRNVLAGGLEGEGVLVDAEDGTTLSVRLTPALVEAYAAELQRHCDELRAFCRQRAWTYMQADIHGDVEALVLQSLRARAVVR